MPKWQINSKAQAAQEKKEENKKKKDVEKAAKKEQLEALSWKEGAKDTSKKQIEQAKRLQKLATKNEAKSLLQKEESEILSKYQKPILKISKKNLSKSDEFAIKQSKLTLDSASEARNYGNPSCSRNLSNVDLSVKQRSATSIETYSASTIDDAIFILDAISPGSTDISSISLDRHPERRIKAAYQAYIEENMPILKKENPSLKHSQLLEMLAKSWKKSPKNPFNQAHISFDTSRQSEKIAAQQAIEQKLDSLKISSNKKS